MAVRVALVGPGRAGSAMAIALVRAGHEIPLVVARNAAPAVASALGAEVATFDQVEEDGLDLDGIDLVLVAVSDDSLVEVATRLGRRTVPAVHLSGLTTPEVLSPMSSVVGSFHPLQTLPDPERGADALRGSHIAVTAEDGALRAMLHELASDIGAHPFDLEASAKPLYHAGASAASNFVTAALAIAVDALAAAGVDAEAARPLTEAAVAAAYDLGPRRALTGPVARGDTGTVRAQIQAMAALGETAEAFAAMVEATARIAGLWSEMEEAVHGDG